MGLSRRALLTGAVAAPWLGGCATDLSKYAMDDVPGLATRLGVCTASFVQLRAGQAAAPMLVSGCGTAPATQHSPMFQAASLTKPVIAFAALTLVRAGQLDLRAPVARYLPNGYAHRQHPFSGPEDRRIDQVPAHTLARMPVGTLLNHSSGLPNWTDGVLVPHFDPGTRWQYSGEGYLLLQAVLEGVSGQGIEALVAERVFNPLGMQRSRLRTTPDIRGQVVDGRTWLGGVQRFDFREPNAAASLLTTADDYAKLVSALVSDADLLALTLADPIAVDPQLGLAWGRGWGIETAAGGPYLWQWGNNPGYRAFAMVSVSSGDGFVLFANSDRGLALVAPLVRLAVPAEHGVLRFHMLD